MDIPEKYQEAVQEFVRRIEKDHHNEIESIILFGSVARGEAREDSDIDILIIIKEEDFHLRRLFIGEAFDTFMKTGKNVSAKVISHNDFQLRKNFSFLKNVIADGVRIA
ncbi:MAG: nucleotidyltransferase domain-containing protein [Methanobacteriaceae archaeon]|nr:nucleotidyltransferase domain-containing protein [Methanobacteriaceae archaeon]MDZ4171922.1 nucleotidyltransferase domain-containing protein [Methanobacteriaceae archaeon]